MFLPGESHGQRSLVGYTSQGRKELDTLRVFTFFLFFKKNGTFAQWNFRQKNIKPSVQFSPSVMSNSVTPRTEACQATLSITNFWSLLKLMSIMSVMPSCHLILCHPLLLPASIFPRIRVFSSESVLHIRWPKYWSFSFSISPYNEYSGLISFRMDWFD